MPRSRSIFKLLALLAGLVMFVAACGDSDDSSDSSSGSDDSGSATEVTCYDGSVTLNGAGSTFAQAFYEQTIQTFMNEVCTDTEVTYGGGGSSAGKQKLADQVNQWAGSDSTVKPEDVAKYKGGAFLYFPTVAAPITVSYNLEGVDELNLSGETLAGIFSLQITSWDDPKIAADNPDADLPSDPIKVAVRADGSGTTNRFTSFLTSAGGAAWTLGTADEIPWPAGVLKGNGNGGVAQNVNDTPGAVGYVDFSDAKAVGLSLAKIKNKDGDFVAPSLKGAEAAVANSEIKPDLTYNPIDAAGAGVYPITAPTFILVYENQTDAAVAAGLKSWLSYNLGDAQDTAADLDYAKLPSDLQEKAVAQIDKITTG